MGEAGFKRNRSKETNKSSVGGSGMPGVNHENNNRLYSGDSNKGEADKLENNLGRWIYAELNTGDCFVGKLRGVDGNFVSLLPYENFSM